MGASAALFRSRQSAHCGHAAASRQQSARGRRASRRRLPRGQGSHWRARSAGRATRLKAFLSQPGVVSLGPCAGRARAAGSGSASSSNRCAINIGAGHRLRTGPSLAGSPATGSSGRRRLWQPATTKPAVFLRRRRAIGSAPADTITPLACHWLAPASRWLVAGWSPARSRARARATVRVRGKPAVASCN